MRASPLRVVRWVGARVGRRRARPRRSVSLICGGWHPRSLVSSWDAQAAFAVKHLVKGQAVAFSGRLEPRPWTTRDGLERVAMEIHGVELEYGAKPRGGGGDADPTDDVPS